MSPTPAKRTKTAKKETTKTAKAAKPPTTAKPKGGVAATPTSPFTSSKDPNTRYTLFTFCQHAEDIEEGVKPVTVSSKQETMDAEFWHLKCPIATVQGARLTLCASDWHHHHARCWVCHGRVADGVELDPERRNCVDLPACAERAKIRLEAHPGYDRWRQFKETVAERQAAEAAANGHQPKKRTPSNRPTSGRCEHCGEPTKGGRFVAGHDAKLKGQLIREAGEGSVAAVAEAMARNWYKPGRYPELEDEAFAIVQATETETLIQQRTAERLGE